ncbi:MAG: ferritin [Actinomycetota bacterium]
MLPKKIEAALNEHIRNELQSAYLYLALSAQCEEQSLPGCAAWLRAQWEEEIAHSMKFYDFIVDRDGAIDLKPLEAPGATPAKPLAIFERALDNERRVTESINELYELVQKERDFASVPLLDWFVTEQIEEEASVSQIVDDLRRVGDQGEGLFLLDKELGRRRSTATAEE